MKSQMKKQEKSKKISVPKFMKMKNTNVNGSGGCPPTPYGCGCNVCTKFK